MTSLRIVTDLEPVKDVHKVPPLDLVGWYTTLPQSGPQAAHTPLHSQILQTYNESALLLGFHPSSILEGTASGGKLPLTIYESNVEADDSKKAEGEDEEMEDGDGQQKMGLKFTVVPYTIETGEAEFIGVDFVARGGGNATAVDSAVKSRASASESGKAIDTEKTKAKGKARKEDSTVEDHQALSREDEEIIASLTAKANAIKMLHARINLISTYLTNLSSSSPSAPPNHELLRSIQALLSRLTLLIPANSTGFSQELISEQNDVNLVGLLNSITQSVKDVRELGKKFSIVDNQKSAKGKNGGSERWEVPSGGGYGNGLVGVGDLLT